EVVVGAVGELGTLAEAGGAFERPIVHVFTVARGRITRHEQFEPEDVDAALARFAELRPDPPSAGLRRTGPLRIPPNAATRVFDRWGERFQAAHLQPLQPLYAPAL